MKNQFVVFVLPFILASATIFMGCKDRQDQARAELAKVDLKRGALLLCGSGQFGQVNFTLGCEAETRETFNLALSLLHSFEYTEAEKAFAKVIDIDPNCAMAYWGVAMCNFHPLWAPPNKEELQKGSQILAIAQQLHPPPRVSAYLDAIGAYYQDWEHLDHRTRTLRFEAQMEALYRTYEDDQEAAIFYALALNASADPADKSYGNQRKAGALLERLFPSQPDHPGIAHYIIHNYDYPELAEMALPTARRYASIAPASAHAQHMPSHIFTRLGLWEESIASNLNSTASALCYSESIAPDAHWDEELHGMDYLVYAYLQMGDVGKAAEQYSYLKSFENIFPVNFKVAYTAAAIPARLALESRDWKAASELELPLPGAIAWADYPWQRSLLHFARGLGAVHLGDLTAAEKELATLEGNKKELETHMDAYKAQQVQIQINSLGAWIAFKKGLKDKALELMREAARMEAQTAKHPVTPGEVLPAGELLADMLLAMGRTEAALAAYEAGMQTHPNRFNGILGAARAAGGLGEFKKAAHYYGKLLQQASSSPEQRSELGEAKALLRKHPV